MVFRIFEERREKWLGVLSDLEKKLDEKGGIMKEELKDPVLMNYLVYGNFFEGLRRKIFLDQKSFYDSYMNDREREIYRLKWFDEKRKDKDYEFKIDRDCDANSWFIGFFPNKDYKIERLIYDSIMDPYLEKGQRLYLELENKKRELENSPEGKIYKFVIDEHSKGYCQSCVKGTVTEEGPDRDYHPFVSFKCEACNGSGKSGYVSKATPKQERIYQSVFEKIKLYEQDYHNSLPEQPSILRPEPEYKAHLHIW
jgi:hypothetical protein